MRLKKGHKVEVMNTREVVISWRCAEILSGNGHTYTVRYDSDLGITSEVEVERVPRKAIRPCPPPLGGVGCWISGDVVEVSDHNLWRIATVLMALGGDYYLVRLLGSSRKIRIHKMDMRVRQSWQDNKWVVMGKGSGRAEGARSKMLLNSNYWQKTTFQVTQANARFKMQAGDDYVAAANNARLVESHVVSSRTLKRTSPYCSSLFEAYTGNFQKMRAIEKEGRRQRVVVDQLPEKVDAVTCPGDNMGGKHMHASFDNAPMYSEPERQKLNGDDGCSLARSLDSNSTESDECSVGSCSITRNSPYKYFSRFVSVPCQETDALCSDAESCCNSGEREGNCSLPSEEEVAANIHWLELHAYRCTLEALYASGPLSWDQELLLTNLRFTLHISNDEHSMELRKVMSAGHGINNGQ